MGGAVPLGYRVENRALHVVEDEAEFVRALFRRYLEVGSVVRLKTVLDAENLRSPVRTSRTGRRTGGGLMSRGHLYWILSNPIYVGRLRHKGQIHDGLHPAIVETEPWDRVQQQPARPERRAASGDHHRQLPRQRAGLPGFALDSLDPDPRGAGGRLPDLGILYESYIHPITIISTLPSAGVGALAMRMLFHFD